jgi:hypothetical protein
MKNTATILRNQQVHIWICFRTSKPSLHWKIKGVKEVGYWSYWTGYQLPETIKTYVKGREGSRKIHRAFAARCIKNYVVEFVK